MHLQHFHRARLATAVVTITVAGLALAACGGGGSSNVTNAPPAAKSISGTVIVAEPGDNPGDIALRRQLAAAFMKAHPAVKVHILIVPATNYDQKVQTMIAGGTPPDIFTSGDVQIPNIVAKHLALNLMPYVKRDAYSLAGFYPQVIRGLTYGGELVGLTDNWDTEVMYYNATLFKKAGVAPPTANWTWPDFTSAAAKLTSGSGTNKIYGAVFDNWFAPIYDQIWENGGDPFPVNSTKCGYDSPQSVAAFNQIVGLYKSGASPTPTQFGNQGAEQYFLSGKVAMMIGSGRWAAYDMRDITRFDWKVVPIPKGPAGRANFFHLSMFAIAATSQNKEAAWAFLKYMVSPQGIRSGLAADQGIPSRPSIANSTYFRDSQFNMTHNSFQPFIESLPTVRRAPNLPNFNQVNDTVSAQLDTLWQLKTTPQQVLPNVCKQVTPLLSGNAAPGGG